MVRLQSPNRDPRRSRLLQVSSLLCCCVYRCIAARNTSAVQSRQKNAVVQVMRDVNSLSSHLESLVSDASVLFPKCSPVYRLPKDADPEKTDDVNESTTSGTSTPEESDAEEVDLQYLRIRILNKCFIRFGNKMVKLFPACCL